MFKYQSVKNSGAKSWILQRISGIALVILMIGHYILMHYHPDSGHTYEAVMARMQHSWYRIIDLLFLTLGFYHGLNGIWGIFRDYNMKPWLKISLLSAIVILGISFVAWGFNIIFSIPYLKNIT
jgi:succinate dehydrogenase / fumarate reductase membrane anchor subunit